LYAKEDRGAELVIIRLDGRELRGELIVVKQRSLLLMETDSGADVSVNLRDVDLIKVVRKSKVALGAGLGLVAGAGMGAILGYSVDQASEEMCFMWFGESSVEESKNVVLFAVIGGFVGALGGGLTGALSSRPEKFEIAGQSQERIKAVMEHLRSKARVKSYN
jgi:hypothetical protein